VVKFMNDSLQDGSLGSEKAGMCVVVVFPFDVVMCAICVRQRPEIVCGRMQKLRNAKIAV